MFCTEIVVDLAPRIEGVPRPFGLGRYATESCDLTVRYPPPKCDYAKGETNDDVFF